MGELAKFFKAYLSLYETILVVELDEKYQSISNTLYYMLNNQHQLLPPTKVLFDKKLLFGKLGPYSTWAETNTNNDC